jgi:predicted acylesterase/phospholipase RssA
MTFEEAYQKTGKGRSACGKHVYERISLYEIFFIGRTFCITLSATTKKAPPVLVNHISAPNVVIASAIVASAAVPGLIPPVRLLVKDRKGNIKEQGENKDELYWDGSIEQVKFALFLHRAPSELGLYSHRFFFGSSDQDIPTAGLAEMLNCQFFVAAQCNPHIVPFFFDSKGDVGRPSRWSSGRREDSWRGGFLLSALELYLKVKPLFFTSLGCRARAAFSRYLFASLTLVRVTCELSSTS